MAQQIFDKRKDPNCTPTCVRDLNSTCPGRVWSLKGEETSNLLVKCLCPCHDNDSEPLNYEQKEWLKRRMSATMGQPYKPFPGIKIQLKWREGT